MVFLLYVEPDPADLGVRFCLQDDRIVDPTKDSPAAPGGVDVDALNPPKDAVAPVAPFVREHELSDEPWPLGFSDFGYHEESVRWCVEQRQGPLPEPRHVKVPVLGFKCHGCAERDD